MILAICAEEFIESPNVLRILHEKGELKDVVTQSGLRVSIEKALQADAEEQREDTVSESPPPLVPMQSCTYDTELSIAHITRLVKDLAKESDVGAGCRAVLTMHITYSRGDSELLVRIQDAVGKAKWDISGVMSNQGSNWFEAWRSALKKAHGVCVCFYRR